jgi:bifunctional DNA-binding transcriptional regulator/antitoxin component of YhaV-PrlF toxin-antitoxin module
MGIKDRKSSYVIALGARGRLVLPAELRQAFGLAERDRLVVTVEAPGVLRLTSAREVARRSRGALREAIGDRDLASELLAERREEGKLD